MTARKGRLALAACFIFLSADAMGQDAAAPAGRPAGRLFSRIMRDRSVQRTQAVPDASVPPPRAVQDSTPGTFPETPEASTPGFTATPGSGSGTSPTDSSTASNTDLSLPRAEREGGGGEPTTGDQAGEEAAEPSKDETKLLMDLLGIPDSPVKVYGWIQNSYTGNTNGMPKNGTNFGVNPNFKANSWMGNQYYLVVENPLEQSDEINFGFRADNLWGNDWQFNHMAGFADRAFNLNSFQGYDLAQAYAEVHIPDNVFGTKGLDIKGGRFYTLAGYEVVPATGRPLLSVPYMFNYGQPFTHFGMVSTWHVNDRLNIYNGAINGWDRWINENYKWGYIGGFTYNFKDEKTNISFISIWGPNQFPRQLPNNTQIFPTGYINIPSLAGAKNNGYASNDRLLFTTVITHKWSDKLTQVIETDQGFEQNVPGAASPVVNGVVQNGASQSAGWYSFGNWFLYKFNKDNDKLMGVWRSEIFRDNNGVRTGFATNFSEFTLGLIYKPKPYVWVRPEARYDFARSGNPYSDGTRNSQFTLGFDVIFLF
ncbi:outer membrane beta-barrel protein [Isosphaeraceae bacterium EP7]